MLLEWLLLENQALNHKQRKQQKKDMKKLEKLRKEINQNLAQKGKKNA